MKKLLMVLAATVTLSMFAVVPAGANPNGPYDQGVNCENHTDPGGSATVHACAWVFYHTVSPTFKEGSSSLNRTWTGGNMCINGLTLWQGTYGQSGGTKIDQVTHNFCANGPSSHIENYTDQFPVACSFNDKLWTHSAYTVDYPSGQDDTFAVNGDNFYPCGHS